MWRPLRFVPHLVLVVALAVGLTLALATRFPEARILAAAEGWPLVGPLAERFRERYLPAASAVAEVPAPVGAEAASPVAPEVEIVQVLDPELVGIRPKLWAPAGTAIYRRRDLSAEVWTRVEHLFPLSLLERQGDWYRVRFGTRHRGFSKGWVYLPGYREPTAEELMAPAPVLPLAPVALRRRAEDAARRWMEASAGEGRCGPYDLLTDVEARSVLAMCERVGAWIETAYVERYGLTLTGKTAETVLLFRHQPAYLGFRSDIAPELGGVAHASPAGGYVAVPVGELEVAEVAFHLVHELTHLLNRRGLGPALPPWLDEGLARDLADRESQGAGVPAAAAGGPPAVSLAELVALDGPSFQAAAERNYRASAEWIGYLLDGPDPTLAAGLRSFFQAVAGGRPINERLLLDHLGREWSELQRG